MHLPPSFWSALAYVASFLNPSTFQQDGLQQPLAVNRINDVVQSGYPGYPEFTVPGGHHAEKELEFNCSYPHMEGWLPCSSPEDRECWLRHPNGSRFDIHTNYEIKAPIGIDRYYEFTITNETFNADGIISNNTKLVNAQYPGPWVQACWGDRIHVTINNQLKHNGTAIHWHGIRMLNEMHADGVPGITQCPIAPGDSYTYSFNTVQYGSSWYHSHYSVQYADGLLGPITIHGPSTAPFDQPVYPTLMTDWFHNSAFRAIHEAPLRYPTILLDGRGDAARFYDVDKNKDKVPYNKPPPPYELVFEKQILAPVAKKARRYLLRLINTSFDTTFVFSIDNHLLQVISADFVPIIPYTTSHILIGIGQRYNVIVEARPTAYPGKDLPTDNNFWIRTTVAPCFGAAAVGKAGYDRAGVLRYDNTSTSSPATEQWPEIPAKPACRDEEMKNLKPRNPWNVTLPANGPRPMGEGFGVEFQSGLSDPDLAKDFPLAKFGFERGGRFPLGFNPLQITYGNPIINHLNNLSLSDEEWPLAWVVVPEDHKETDWVYLAIAGSVKSGGKTGAHPIHLHGHDFAILQQEENMTLSPDTFKPLLDNPPRRDVVLLPTDGFVVIAFKADNPGSWIMHCHIAFHASYGLALQVLERQKDANENFPKDGAVMKETKRVCDNWVKWEGDCTNWWPGKNETLDCYPACPSSHPNSCPDHKYHPFMDDSGI